MPLATFSEFGRDIVFGLVKLYQLRDVGVRNLPEGLGKIADAIGVHREAKLHFGGDLVSIGNRDKTHVVSKSDELGTLPVLPCKGDSSPCSKRCLSLGALPMTDDHFPAKPDACVEMSCLTVAMRGLVQVHEVHVDGGPWKLAVELGMQMTNRLDE